MTTLHETAYPSLKPDPTPRELAIWSRRSAMSTHWMRHTFAIGVLRDNPNDCLLYTSDAADE